MLHATDADSAQGSQTDGGKAVISPTEEEATAADQLCAGVLREVDAAGEVTVAVEEFHHRARGGGLCPSAEGQEAEHPDRDRKKQFPPSPQPPRHKTSPAGGGTTTAAGRGGTLTFALIVMLVQSYTRWGSRDLLNLGARGYLLLRALLGNKSRAEAGPAKSRGMLPLPLTRKRERERGERERRERERARERGERERERVRTVTVLAGVFGGDGVYMLRWGTSLSQPQIGP